MRILYTLLLYLLTPVILIRLWWRGRRASAYRQRWAERFGWFTPLPTTQQQGVWIHAVSVGEVQAALPLIKQLQLQYPQQPLLITTMTPTGSARVQDSLGEQVAHVYLPYDVPDAIQRFLNRTQPKILILMETELWPNLLHTCQRRQIPVVLANARLSARSARGYQRFAGFSRAMLQTLSHIAAQTETDAQRFTHLGANPVHVSVTGSIKFDLSIPDSLSLQAKRLRAEWGRQRPVWIAGSTHADEEAQILVAFKEIRQTLPDTLLILVPRHPERFVEVADLCSVLGFDLARRSQGELPQADTAIYLGDTMGELLLLYAASDVAFVGGSLVARGGHNPLEPAAVHVPVVLGPHTFNFAEISDKLLSLGAATRVHDASTLTEAVLNYLQQSAARQYAGQVGQQFVLANRGALTQLTHIIAESIELRN